MSGLKRMKYNIVPSQAYKVIRGCPGCGCKSCFSSTEKFRVNANGTSKELFGKNKAEPDWQTLEYELLPAEPEQETPESWKGYMVEIHNPSGCRIRTDRLLAKLLPWTRSSIRKMQERGELVVSQNRTEQTMTVCILNEV